MTVSDTDLHHSTPPPRSFPTDSIPIVAADFGSDADTLAAASGIANKDVIFPGDIITVPCP